MRQSFSPPRIRSGRWLLAAALAGMAAIASMVALEGGLSLALGLSALAAGLAYGARRAFVQQRIAEAATLYSLETGRVESRDAHRAA